MAYPTQFRYTKDHEWVYLEGDVAKVGITDYAQDQLGDIVYVELPEVRSEIKKGDSVAVVESPKSAADVFAPLTGTVVEVNVSLISSPETINKDPHGAGWLFKLEINNPPEIKNLLDAAGYEQFISEK